MQSSPPLPSHLTYSQVGKNRMQAFGKGYYFVYHGVLVILDPLAIVSCKEDGYTHELVKGEVAQNWLTLIVLHHLTLDTLPPTTNQGFISRGRTEGMDAKPRQVQLTSSSSLSMHHTCISYREGNDFLKKSCDYSRLCPYPEWLRGSQLCPTEFSFPPLLLPPSPSKKRSCPDKVVLGFVMYQEK